MKAREIFRIIALWGLIVLIMSIPLTMASKQGDAVGVLLQIAAIVLFSIWMLLSILEMFLQKHFQSNAKEEVKEVMDIAA